MSVENLTNKQLLFAERYASGVSIKQAALDAGYSPRTAQAIGSRLVKNKDVQKFVEDWHQRTTQRTNITADRVLLELARLAFFNPKNLYDDDGQPKPLSDIDDDTAACIADIATETVLSEDGTSASRVLRYKTYSKDKALDTLVKFVGLLERQQEKEDTGGIIMMPPIQGGGSDE